MRVIFIRWEYISCKHSPYTIGTFYIFFGCLLSKIISCRMFCGSSQLGNVLHNYEKWPEYPLQLPRHNFCKIVTDCRLNWNWTWIPTYNSIIPTTADIENLDQKTKSTNTREHKTHKLGFSCDDWFPVTIIRCPWHRCQPPESRMLRCYSSS